MLYNTGTIAINGNTATGTGTNWTAPTSQVRAGQTIIVMSNPVQMFQISAVNSATSMTVTPAASPALSGQKYGILVSDNISVDGLAQAMSQLIKDYDENIGAWETFATTTANQSITVTINGKAVSIPAIGKLLQKGSNGALAVADGGTGATTKEDARTNLGLGSSATRRAYSTSGDMLSEGDMGIGSPIDLGSSSVSAINLPSSFWMKASPPYPSDAPLNGAFLLVNIGPNAWNTQIGFPAYENRILIRSRTSANGNFNGWTEFYSTANTTKTSDGTLKAASPIVQINRDGSYQINDESEGCTVTRLGVGQYLIEGCMGMNADAAWGGKDGGFEIPTDRNKQPLIWLDYEVNPDGSVLVKTFHRTHPGAPTFARNDVSGLNDGDPVDIPGDQFVSVRVEMPADSRYNLNQLQEVSQLNNEANPTYS